MKCGALVTTGELVCLFKRRILWCEQSNEKNVPLWLQTETALRSAPLRLIWESLHPQTSHWCLPQILNTQARSNTQTDTYLHINSKKICIIIWTESIQNKRLVWHSFKDVLIFLNERSDFFCVKVHASIWMNSDLTQQYRTELWGLNPRPLAWHQTAASPTPSEEHHHYYTNKL